MENCIGIKLYLTDLPFLNLRCSDSEIAYEIKAKQITMYLKFL